MAVLRAPTPADQPVGALVSRVGTDVARLIRAEIALVQLRVTAALRAVREAGVGCHRVSPEQRPPGPLSHQVASPRRIA